MTSSLQKINHENLKLDKELNSLRIEIRNTIYETAWYLLIHALQKQL